MPEKRVAEFNISLINMDHRSGPSRHIELTQTELDDFKRFPDEFYHTWLKGEILKLLERYQTET